MADTDRTAPLPDPVIPPHQSPPELTLQAVIAGALLGIVFGASSLYLVLKVGLTVSASIPVSVLSITLFRLLTKTFRVRNTTILENNIVQTAGSAGESIAFGLGVTVPAVLALGFELEIVRAMVVGVLGGLLGILMMIPLRRAFIVAQHHELPYPEGTAAAEVLKVGEKGGSGAKYVFGGFGLGFLYKALSNPLNLLKGEVEQPLYNKDTGAGLQKGYLAAEISPELLGVGYIIGPRVASIMLSGGLLAYLVLVPLIARLGGESAAPIAPGKTPIASMGLGEIRTSYILYIGAGAVATGGIISMLQALPIIFGSIAAGIRDVRSATGAVAKKIRTERDLPGWFVLLGTIGLVAALTLVPNVGLGLSIEGLCGAGMVVVFGFLFVTVSSRITGQIGSSSNPISGMTVATLLVTCLIFLALGKVGPQAQLTALTVAAVVCIASSNGGTTAQDLKTGFLVGATPYKQQIAILVGALTSALVMGVTLLALNDAGTIYTKNPKYIPPADYKYADVAALVAVEKPSRGLKEPDDKTYKVLHVAEGALVLKASGKPDFVVEQGKYLIADDGRFAYMVDPAINGRVANDKGERVADNGVEIKNSFNAPKTKLMSFIITGVLGQKLPWDWVILGALIAIVLELCGVASLPFAVGVYLPLATSVPIFIGGMLRWIVERTSKRSAADSESSPGVLLSSGYIAGGTIAGVVAAFLQFAPDGVKNATNLATALVVETPAATTVDAEKLKGPLAAAREAASGASASGQSLKTALEKAPGGSDETRAAAAKIQDAAADLQSRAKSAGDAGRKFKELAPDDGATKSYPEWYDVFQKNEWPSVAVFSLLAVILLFTGYLKVEAPAGVQERTKNGE